MTEYRTGDWVTITVRITELHPNGVDLGVELFSKTDQYTAFVRRNLCARTAKLIPDEPDEGSVALLAWHAYQRLGDGHWYAAGSAEDAPGRTWGELNQMGDVEVIHHG